MNRFEQKRMSLFQRATFALLLLVCILLVVVLLPVNEGETARVFVRRSKAFFGRRYNSTYPLTKPTSELPVTLCGSLVVNLFCDQTCRFDTGREVRQMGVSCVRERREALGGLMGDVLDQN